MITKTRIYLVIILLVCTSVYSCSDEFLNRQPQGTLNAENLTSKKGVESLLVGAYSLLDGSGSTGATFNVPYPASPRNWIWDCASDDAYKGSALGDFSDIGLIERYENLPSNIELKNHWMIMYDGVSRANDVLRTLKKVRDNFDDTKANEIEGQAKFLRAWFHMQLQRLYYKIPYITEDVKAETVKNDHVIWPEIEKDLQFGIDHLPSSFPGEPAKATKWAAMSVKAYVYLLQDKYSKAKPLLDKIINSGQFKLVANFRDNYSATTEHNAESIFEIEAAVNDGTDRGVNGNNASFVTNPHNRFTPTCCGVYQPSQDLVNAFKVNSKGLPLLGINGPKFNDKNLKNDMGIKSDEEFHPTDRLLDPRLDWTVGRRGIPYLDWGIQTGYNWIRAQVNGGPYNTQKQMFYKKNMDIASHNKFPRANALNFRVIRFAHVLLWRAECAVNEGDLGRARKLINRVRERASDDYVMGKVSTYQFSPGVEPDVDYSKPAANYKLGLYNSFPSKEYAWGAVRMEERLEFALEGWRFYDLRRWGIADKVLNKYIKNDSEFRTFMQGAHYDKGINDHWPIPQNQIDIQPDVLKQDPAYK